MLNTIPIPIPARRVSVPRPSSPGCRRARWVARPTVAVVPRLRVSVRVVLDDWRVAPERGELLLLAASELVTNAVCHAGAVTSRLSATLALGGGWLRFEVADGDPALPDFGQGGDVEAEGGRGLMIVGLLAAEAGGGLVAFPVGAGKVVGIRVPAV
ncbi:ATP-binding protein [Streptomyces sp. NBC_00212]|uniref:ATP-binding protein n=1 Tax=Streptomyces sp. NBC_00212 TaxID=2975684 RepID=UPI00324C24AF